MTRPLFEVFKYLFKTLIFAWFQIPENLLWFKTKLCIIAREKGRDLTQSYDKSPYTNRNVKRAKWQHKQRHKKFDYTTVVDRLRTVSWSNHGYPTGVVNRFYGAHLPTHRNSCVINGKNMQILLYSDIKIVYI